MDIQKEIELFQEFVCEWQEFEKGDPIFAMRNNKYLHPQMQDDFELWQRVKVQAVPEGFVLVPKEPTEKMLQAGYDNKNFMAKAYKAMIEAQEQKG